MPLFQPLLADFQGLIAVAFLVLSVIGWVVNQAGGQNNPPPKPGAPPRAKPRRQQVQNEIDSFLQQATGQRPARNRQDVVAEEDIEIVEEPSVRRPVAPERRPPQQRPQPARPAVTPPRTTTQLPQPAISPRVGSTPLGSNVRQHVETHLADHISRQVSESIPHSIDRSVAAHLGQSSMQEQQVPDSLTLAAGIIQSVRKQDEIRRAIILNEVLSPPLSRRTLARRT